MRWLNSIVLFLCVLPLATAGSLSINFIASDHSDLNDLPVTLTFGEALFKGDLNGPTLSLPIQNHGQTFEALLDSPQTPAPDFYGTNTIKSDQDTLEIQVYPVGYLQGNVLDREDNLIPEAKLSLTCYSSFTLKFPENTDDTGHFSLSKIPTGTCLVTAYNNGAVGQKEVEIIKGEVTTADIILEKNIAKENSGWIWVIVVVLLIIILGVGTYLLYFKKEFSKPHRSSPQEKKEVEKNIESETEVAKLSTSAKAILETLNDKEKAVVNFLLENQNEASQAKIRYATKIPRTSLARVLTGLEHKKLTHTSKEGKCVSVRLTGAISSK